MTMFINKHGSLIPDLEHLQRPENEYSVLLYSDNVHTFAEVIVQLMKATSYSEKKAFNLALAAHENEYTIVCSDNIHRCRKVAKILEEINLKTRIVSIN